MTPTPIPLISYSGIPAVLVGTYLPKPTISVNKLLQFNLPPLSPVHQASPSLALSSIPPSTALSDTFLRSIPIPTKNLIESFQATLTIPDIGAQSIQYSNKASMKFIPLCVLSVWHAAHTIHQTCELWRTALDWMNHKRDLSMDHFVVVRLIYKQLSAIEWGGTLTGFSSPSDPLTATSKFASDHWLSDQHMEQVQDILRWRIKSDSVLERRITIEGVFFSKKVIEGYETQESGAAPSTMKWLNRVGGSLESGEKDIVSGVVHVGGNHWIAFAVDFRAHTIAFGDPYSNPIETKIISAFQWWTSQHSTSPFTVTNLPITHQKDSFSCGILTLNALEHVLSCINRSSCLISSTPSALSLTRLRYMHAILQRHFGQNDAWQLFSSPTTSQHQNRRFKDDDDGIEYIGIKVPDRPAQSSTISSPTADPIEIADDSDAPSSPFLHPEYTTSPFIDRSIQSDWGSLDGYLTDPDSVIYFEDNDPSGHDTRTPPPSHQLHSSPLTPLLPTPSGQTSLKRSRESPTSNVSEFLNKFPRYDIRSFLLSDPTEIAEHAARRQVQEAERKVAQQEAMGRVSEAAEEARRRKEREKKARQRARKKAEAERRKEREERVAGTDQENPLSSSPMDSKSSDSNILQSAPSSKSVSTSASKASKRRRTPPPLVNSLPYATTLAELSRPKRSLSAARLPGLIQPEKLAKNVNWKAGFLWSEIDSVARRHNFKNPSAIVSELQVRNPVFSTLRSQVLGRWIEKRPDGTHFWAAKVLERAGEGYNTCGDITRFPIFDRYPDVIDAFIRRVSTMRTTGLAVDTTNARTFLVAYIESNHPRLFREPFNGKQFTCSETFVCKLFHHTLGWTRRAATRAAQKVPIDWEEQCRQARLRMAFLIKEYDIPSSLIVNIDQTQCIYNMATSRTWAPTGEKQVAVVGKEEKRAITVTVAIKPDGHALPLQATYLGRSLVSTPSPSAPDYQLCREGGHRFVYSGTSTYWANIETIKDLVNHVIATDFEQTKRALGLPSDQKCILYLDVWSVHRSEAFREWMRTNHPTILLLYVPANCTSLFQPCDTGAQRPFKHAVRRAQVADAIEESMSQISAGRRPEDVKLSTSLPLLRDRTPRWILRGYEALTKDVVSKAFELCRLSDPTQNLSYSSLTSIATRQALRNLRWTHPTLHKELTNAHNRTSTDDYFKPSIPPLPLTISEDSVDDGCDDVDDSDVPTSSVTAHVLSSNHPDELTAPGTTVEGEAVGMELKSTDEVGSSDGSAEGSSRPKRIRTQTKMYTAEFWLQH